MADQSRPARIAVAQLVMDRIRALPTGLAAAAENVIRTIGIVPGEPVDLPNARPGAPYQAQVPPDPAVPVIIYRKTQPGERGDYLVVSLMTADEYRQHKVDERSEIMRDPGVRYDIAVAAGTAASIFVKAVPGAITPVPLPGTREEQGD